MRGGRRSRLVARMLPWQVVGSTVTSAVAFAVTRRVSLSLVVGGLDLVFKLGFHWLSERRRGPLAGTRDGRPIVVWFTGLSGAGKSTVAGRVAEALRRRGLQVEELDGDSLRQIFPGTGFTKADRDSHTRRVGFLASKLEQNGVCVVASFVSPYRESREFVRGLCQNFMEVYVSAPLEVCERRDVKGLYAKARRGEIRNFTGIDDPYEPPDVAEVVIDTSLMDVTHSVDLVMNRIGEHGVAPIVHTLNQGGLRRV